MKNNHTIGSAINIRKDESGILFDLKLSKNAFKTMREKLNFLQWCEENNIIA